MFTFENSSAGCWWFGWAETETFRCLHPILVFIKLDLSGEYNQDNELQVLLTWQVLFSHILLMLQLSVLVFVVFSAQSRQSASCWHLSPVYSMWMVMYLCVCVMCSMDTHTMQSWVKRVQVFIIKSINKGTKYKQTNKQTKETTLEQTHNSIKGGNISNNQQQYISKYKVCLSDCRIAAGCLSLA